MAVSGVMEIVSTVTGAVITQVKTFVKILQTEHLRCVHFTADQLYLNF